MKILFFDSMFPQGHKVINGKYLDILSKMQADVYVCAEDGWFEIDERFHQVSRKWVIPSNGKIKPRIQIMANLFKAVRVIKKVNPDIIYIASYDIITILLFLPFLYKYKNRIYLQEHNNIDQLNNRIKFAAYSAYKNFFHHLVFERYIQDKLISYGVLENLISVVPHPIPNAYLNTEEKNIQPKDLVVGLSNSNSNDIMRNIVYEQKEKGFLNSTNFYLVLKSTDIDYEDKHLKVFHGWINNSDYSSYCQNCKYFIIPFPTKGYSYRVSNVFMEAISNGKKVIASRFPLVEYYANTYPDICKIFDHVEEIPSLLNMEMEEYSDSRLKFLDDHSDNKILDAFNSAFI